MPTTTLITTMVSTEIETVDAPGPTSEAIGAEAVDDTILSTPTRMQDHGSQDSGAHNFPCLKRRMKVQIEEAQKVNLQRESLRLQLRCPTMMR